VWFVCVGLFLGLFWCVLVWGLLCWVFGGSLGVWVGGGGFGGLGVWGGGMFGCWLV